MCMLQLKDQKQEQLGFFNYVFNVLKDFTGKTIIVGGDFNTCLNPSLDKLGGSMEKQSETSKQLLNFCDLYNLFDVFRFYNPESKTFTWRNK